MSNKPFQSMMLRSRNDTDSTPGLTPALGCEIESIALVANSNSTASASWRRWWTAQIGQSKWKLLPRKTGPLLAHIPVAYHFNDVRRCQCHIKQSTDIDVVARTLNRQLSKQLDGYSRHRLINTYQISEARLN